MLNFERQSNQSFLLKGEVEKGERKMTTQIFFLCVVLGFELRASVTGRTNACHHTCLFLKWGLANFLPGLTSNSDPPDFHLPSS
jgi:hypothetical protein